MSMLEHMNREFDILGWPGDDEMQQRICKNIEDVVRVISEQGHTGCTIGYLMAYVNKIVDFAPLSPLTGMDDEWRLVSEDKSTKPFYQNIRDPSVFKDDVNEDAWCLDVLVFRDANGNTFTNDMSRVPVEFPWVKPKRVYIDVGGKKDEKEDKDKEDEC